MSGCFHNTRKFTLFFMFISTLSAIASAIFVGFSMHYIKLQQETVEKQRQHFKDQIRYIAILDRNDSNDKFGTLTIRQVSGSPYILSGIWLLPSIEDDIGRLVKGNPFAINILEYLHSGKNLPYYEIESIGQIICHKQPKFKEILCNPNDNFIIKFRYRIFDDERVYHQSLFGRRYLDVSK